MDTATLTTPWCLWCGLGGEATVPKHEAAAFRIGVLHIQDAMPTTPPPIREQILTGTHPACWDAMMAEQEDEG